MSPVPDVATLPFAPLVGAALPTGEPWQTPEGIAVRAAYGPADTAGLDTLAGDGLCVGYDSGDNVSPQYKNPGHFTGGTIQSVAFDTSDKAYVNLNDDAQADFATD